MTSPYGRSRLTANRRKYEIQRLQDSHREVLRLSTLGYSRSKLAAMLSIHPATVTNVRNSELGRAQSEVLANGRDKSTTDIGEKIAELLPGAIKVLEGVVEGQLNMPAGGNITTTQRFKAAQDILGRGGYVPPTRVQGNIDHTLKFSAEDMKLIKERAASLKVNGDIQDAEVIEITAVMEDGNAENSNT